MYIAGYVIAKNKSDCDTEDSHFYYDKYGSFTENTISMVPQVFRKGTILIVVKVAVFGVTVTFIFGNDISSNVHCTPIPSLNLLK